MFIYLDQSSHTIWVVLLFVCLKWTNKNVRVCMPPFAACISKRWFVFCLLELYLIALQRRYQQLLRSVSASVCAAVTHSVYALLWPRSLRSPRSDRPHLLRLNASWPFGFPAPDGQMLPAAVSPVEADLQRQRRFWFMFSYRLRNKIKILLNKQQKCWNWNKM